MMASPLVAVGPRCPGCGKTNHTGVSRCVFCGAGIATLAISRTSRWSEGPDSDPDDAPPSGRTRPSIGSGFEDMTAAPIADPLIGVVVADRYRILEGLGRGGMGIVYRVEHTRIGKLLAMKLLTGELSRNPEVVRRFKHEALTVSKLSSPNTVQVFDFGVSEGLTYLVMELVAGEDLGRALRGTGPMPFARLGKIIIQVCNALAEAHQKGIVHRDIKPENIMLIRAKDGTDIAKVLDFGLAKIREGSDLNDVTSQGAIVGTPYFMSPEQVRGEAVDPRSDIYALGALMYRALTGHYPFNGPTPMAVFTKHLTENPMPLAERAPELAFPTALNAIVLKALSKNPADRFQRVEDLQLALVEEIRQLGTSSVDNLLDSGALRRLANVAQKEAEALSQIAGITAPAVEIATRDEVEAYERKLRRQRYGALGVVAALLIAVGAGGAHMVMRHEAMPKFAGSEIEPNNGPGEATVVPIGRTAAGMLGRRIDLTHSDRDFFAFDVERTPDQQSYVSVRLGGLPNMATCALLYRQGMASAVGQYCVGRPGRDLSIGTLRVEPGRYLIAVMQDLDPYGAPSAPFVHENVSDSYTFLVERVDADPGREVEPNDQVASANVVVPGRGVSGELAWARDEDVYCVAPQTDGHIRWKVGDGPRIAGAVLEVTPLRGTEDGAPVRVHAGGKGAVTESDALTPWTSESILPEPDVSRCVRVRQVYDPWTSERSSVVPGGGNEAYVVEVEVQ
jgi:serine/threonine-protein kinase